MKHVDWNDQADMYSEFAFCELEDTRAYLDVIGVQTGDSVLDVCCGPGRISVLCAERGARVVGIDSAEKMLDHARENAEAFGVSSRCDFRLLDWDHVLPGQNLDKCDVVIASRCHAMMNVEKLSRLASRTVGVQIFANAPSIPALQAVLFSGCEIAGPGSARVADGSEGLNGSDGRAGRGGQSNWEGKGERPGMPPANVRPDGPEAREAIYLKIAEKAFQAGFDPNVRILPERFVKRFDSEGQAVDWVCALRPDLARGNESRVALNVRPFLKQDGDDVIFQIATKAAIIWWDVGRGE